MQDTDESHPEIIHDDMVGKYCQDWYWQGYRWKLEYEEDRIWLSVDASMPWGIEWDVMGDWGRDEIPNCPFCGANIVIAFLHDTLSPWEFFTGEKPGYES